MQFTEFNLEKIKPGSAILIEGSRGTGKTTLANHLLTRLPQNGVVCNPIQLSNHQYSNLIQTDNLEDFWKKRSEVKDSEKVLVFEDYPFSRKEVESHDMRHLLMNGRHLKESVLVCTQHSRSSFNPQLRHQFDFVFVYWNTSIQNRKDLYNSYFGVFPTFEEFEKIFSEYSRDFTFLVLDARIPARCPQECIFYFKAMKEDDENILF